MATDAARRRVVPAMHGGGLAALVGVAAICCALATPSAADPVAGRKKAMMCQACHGMDGLGTNPTVPNIGGESEIYLITQLKAFRSGARTHEQMSIIAKGLSDDDIRNLADYYAAIEITVTVPEL